MDTQFRCSAGPAIFCSRVNGFVSMGPNLAKSTFGQGANASPVPAGAAPAAAGAAAPVITDLTNL